MVVEWPPPCQGENPERLSLCFSNLLWFPAGPAFLLAINLKRGVHYERWSTSPDSRSPPSCSLLPWSLCSATVRCSGSLVVSSAIASFPHENAFFDFTDHDVYSALTSKLLMHAPQEQCKHRSLAWVSLILSLYGAPNLVMFLSNPGALISRFWE